jgi:hypothetical protein
LWLQARSIAFTLVTAEPKIYVALDTDTGATATMMTRFTHCMTLRIPPELDSLIADAAHDARLPKSSWIRAAIHQRLARVRRTETSMREPVLR